MTLACLQQISQAHNLMWLLLTVMECMQATLGLCMSAHSCLSPQQMYIMTQKGHMSHELTCHEIAH